MTLDAYLEAKHDTATELASRLGISGASVSRIRNGTQRLSLSLAARIVVATGGKVTLEDLALQEAA